ncbi:sensor histidine kinase [Coleofasciculus sp. E1-EBD-02]|uniref:sensor histidine kinase n=1 Tax=Coleofasciculus sp. E1-EBD-02 TaxID=3068481 RepID=UPI0032F811D4
MQSLITHSLTAPLFMPHGNCYLWQPGLVWLHVLSDAFIALAYASIPLTLIYFVYQRRNLPFSRIFLMFAAFIIACGMTHAMAIWTIWHPDYWLSGLIKAITALISVYTALELIPLMPKAFDVASAVELEAANQRLETEIQERQQTEVALRRSQDEIQQKATLLEKALRDLQHAQAQLVHTEKMSSLGQLVAGLAHEINNPVNFIFGNLVHAKNYAQNLLDVISLYDKHYPQPVPEIQAAAEQMDLGFLREDLPHLLESMEVGTKRIRQIILSLRNFARMDQAEVKAVDLHEGLEGTLLILQNQLKAKPGYAEIQIVKEYGDLPKVECYAGQLNQVFMNLLSNAIDALEESRTTDNGKNYPTIRIRTEAIAPNQVAIRIIDNGPGMTEKTQHQLFDPFFTTKPVGKGTGLGLSISYQIVVDRHQGQLNCRSAPGQGAEFAIAIPIQQHRQQQIPQTEASLTT